MSRSPTHSDASMNHSNPFADPPNAPQSLPAATIAMINIHAHVPVKLDMETPNFASWRTFFQLAFQKFGLADHVDGSLDAAMMHHDPEWLQIDSCIVSWLYATVTPSIMTMVRRDKPTAENTWNAICGLFLDNSLQRAVYAQQEFHSLYQGDMTINEYCGKLKELSDTMHDVGAPVSDQTLVINLLRGLNPKFGSAISVLTSQVPPPTFLYARTYLLQEETRAINSAKMEAATALMAQAAHSGTTTPRPPTPPSANDGQRVHNSSSNNSGNNGATNNWRRKKRKTADNKAGHHTGAQLPPGSHPGMRLPSPGAPPWTMAPNPWTGVVQAWPLPPWRAPTTGLLGPRPGPTPPQPQGLLATTPTPGWPSTPTPVPQPTPELYAALHGMSTTAPYNGGGDWFMDTGASAHMATHPGSSHQDDSSPL